ncbi:MAG: hypothetical protein ACFFDH_12785 [Promethearchaeota archaeon]
MKKYELVDYLRKENGNTYRKVLGTFPTRDSAVGEYYRCQEYTEGYRRVELNGKAIKLNPICKDGECTFHISEIMVINCAFKCGNWEKECKFRKS